MGVFAADVGNEFQIRMMGGRGGGYNHHQVWVILIGISISSLHTAE